MGERFMPLYCRGSYTEIIDGRKGADIDHPTAVITRTCCHTCKVYLLRDIEDGGTLNTKFRPINKPIINHSIKLIINNLNLPTNQAIFQCTL